MKVTSPVSSALLEHVQATHHIDNLRLNKALNILYHGDIFYLANGNFQVLSQSRPGQTHQVNPFQESCTCERATYHHEICPHLTSWLVLREIPMKQIQPDWADPIAIREYMAKVNAPQRLAWVEEV